MENASGKEKIGIVSPLDHALYNQVYNKALFPNSTEYRRADGSEGPMLSYVKELLLRVRPKTMISIGTGTGEYDAELLRCANLFVENYIAIEPNPHHAKQISLNLGKDLVENLTIIEEPFDENFSFEKLQGVTADFIMFAHALYFVTNPGETVRHALSVLNRRGSLLVQQQAHDTAISRGFYLFNQQYGVEWKSEPDISRQNHLITAKTIANELSALNIDNNLHEEPAVFFVDSFYNGDEETALLLLCFMMNTDASKMPAPFVEAWKDWVKEHSSFNKTSGRYELPHNQGFVVVER